MSIHLDRVPLRDASLTPEEILMSESQERMMAVVEPHQVQPFLTICKRWGVEATDIGEVSDTGRLVIDWHGQTVVDVPPRSVAHDGPVYERPVRRPAVQDALASDSAVRLPRPDGGAELRATLLALAASPNLCDTSWITDQYDRYVQGNTVLAQPHDAAVIRIDEESGRGVAVSTDCNARFVRLDPYAGAQLALAESYRNVAVAGARPIAVTDCLNFGSPEDPEVMWQFAESVRGLADGCRELGIPVTGGNVSFYNQTGDTAILPTPVVGVLGVMDDVRRRAPIGFTGPGCPVYLLGETRDELNGSEWAAVVHQHVGGGPPAVDFAAERALATVLVTAAAEGLMRSAHDLAEGGLAQALVESCLCHGVGVRVDLPAGMEPFVALFSETPGRALVSVRAAQEERLVDLCGQRGVLHTRLGETADPGAALDVADVFTLSLDELRAAWTTTLPAAFDGV